MNKLTLRTTLLSLSTALLLGITGCSSGGSDSGSSGDTTTQVVAKVYSGIGIDGILVGSTVCVDGNPTNNQCDAEEPSAITDDKGKFSIPATTVTGPLLLVGGVDNSTGAAFTGSLKAPAGSTVVTPLTSAVQSLVESGKSVEDAQTNVKAAMGLTGANDVNLTSFDPYEEIDGANATQAQAVLAKQTQLQVLVHSATVTVAGADNSTDVNSTMSSVFDAIVENFDGATGEVALDADKVTAATKKAADTVYEGNLAARVAAKAIAQTSAEGSVRDADAADAAISGGLAADATSNLDAAITKVNTSAETELRQAAIDAKAAADANAAALAEIDRLQKAQQAKDAEIAAAKAAQEKAEADAAAAKAEAQRVLADAQATAAEQKAAYEAQLEAEAVAAKAAAEKAAADEAAALAAKLAAEQEKLIAAEAAQREAEAAAAEAQAAAEKAEAEARQAAADKAAADAKAAADLAAAQQAAADAEAAAALGIAQAKVNANVQIANFYVVQASRDANVTRTLAGTYPAADTNATTAEAARDLAIIAAHDTNVTITSDTVDVNASLDLSKAKLDATAAQAAIAAAALEDAYKVKADAELAAAAQVALQAKIGRITEIVVDVNSTKNAAQNLYDVNATAIADAIDGNMTAIGAIASNPLYVGALAKFNDANASVQIALGVYSDVNASLALINQAYTDVNSALSDVNQTAAEAAQAVADEEKAKLEGYFAIANAQVDIIAGLLQEVQAIKTAVDNEPVLPGSLPTNFGGLTDLYEIYANDEGVRSYLLSFNNGSLLVTQYVMDHSGAFIVDSNSTGNDNDLVLDENGNWVTSNTFNTYTYDPSTLVATFADGTEVKVQSVIALDTSTGDVIRNEIDSQIPGDINVSFNEGDYAVIFALKEVERYAVWEPVAECHGDWNTTANECTVEASTFTTLEDAMNSNTSPAGADSSNGWIPIDFDVKINDNVPTALVSGDNGNLVRDRNTSDVVGTWSVITLPNGDLAILSDITVENKERYLNEDPNVLYAVVDGKVQYGSYTQASTSFVPEESFKLNYSAYTAVVSTIAANIQAQPANPLAGQTLWSMISDNGQQIPNSLESQTFSADGTSVNWKEIVNPGSNDLCEGNLGVVLEANATVTLTIIDETCGGVATGEEGTFNVPVDLGDIASGYVFVGGNKWYFSEEAARADFLGGSTTPPVAGTAVASLDLGSMSISNYSPEDEFREWWWEKYVLDENNTYVVDPNSGRPDDAEYKADFTITLNGTTNIKYLGTVAVADFNTAYGASFDNGAEIYKFAFLRATDQVDTWGEVAKNWSDGSGSDFTSLEGVIAAYDGTNGKIYSNEGFDDGGLAFGANGTLIIVDANGSVVNANAGTYEIVNGNGTTDSFTRALITRPTYQGYSSTYNMAFAEEGGEILYGDFFEAGSGGVAYFFNEVAKNQFINYFNTNKDTITEEIGFGEEFSTFTTEWNALSAVDASGLDGSSFYEFHINMENQESTPLVFNATGYFDGTKYFVNEDGVSGYRTYDAQSGSYVGAVDNSTVSGGFIVSPNNSSEVQLIENGGTPQQKILVFTHLDEVISGSGEAFELDIQGSTSVVKTYMFDSETERDAFNY